jgi:serine/threonine protein kinase/tetratricopeptide (TPR) repeat protein
MGAVYLATDRLTGDSVALKRVATQPDAPGSDALRLALTREFATLAALRHPNVIGVLDYGFDEQRQPYFTMTLVDDARTLREAGYNQPLPRKIELIIQLLQALVYLHRRGIIHRDLKPENVLVTAEGQVKVLDFGLAQAGRRHATDPYAGTLRYMAPEVLRGEVPDTSADLYSVGVMAFELLTGRNPFQGHTPQALLENILTSQPDMTGIDILTGGELRQAARHNVSPMPPNETQVRADITPDGLANTVLFDPLLPEDDIPTRLVNRPDGLDDATTTTEISLTTDNPFVRIIQRLIAKSPRRRYSDASEVIDHLNAAMGSPRPSENSAIRESFLQTAPLVGRDSELMRLTAALRTTITGHGGLWLVSGESGVGKSRLLDEMRARAIVQGVVVLRGQAVSDGGLPYEMWREPLKRMVLGVDVSDADAAVLKQVVPDIEALLERPVANPPALDATDSQERLLATIGQLVARYSRAMPGGVLLILEDLQWEKESLTLLHSLQQRAPDLPLLIVGNYRNDEAPDLPHHFPGCMLLHLERLSAAQIACLSESMLGAAGSSPQVVSLLQRETEGNPLFVIEVARALAEEAGALDVIDARALPERVVSGGIHTLLQRRLDHVPPDYRRLLQLAAVHGRQIEQNVMEQLAGSTSVEDWLTVCVNAAVIDRQDGRWRFAHDRLREQLLYSLPPAEREVLYRSVAEAVEAVYAGALNQQAATLAYLWANAGNAEREYHYSQIAAQSAVATSAYVEAHRLVSRALTLLLKGDVAYSDAQEITLNITLGNVEQALGQYERACTHLTTALRLARRSQAAAQVAEALIGIGWVNVRQGHMESARHHSEEAVEIVRAQGGARLLVEASHLNGLIDVIEGRNADAEELLLACLPLARTLQDRMQEANILNALGTAQESLGRHAEAQRHLSEALHLTTTLGNRYLAANVQGNLGRLHYYQGRYVQSRAHFSAALPMYREGGNIFGEASALCFISFIDLAEGKPEQAAQRLEESIRLSVQIGAGAITLIGLCGIARLLMHYDYDDFAAELLGMILQQATDAAVEREAVPLLNVLGERMPAAALDAALERGKQQDVDGALRTLARLREETVQEPHPQPFSKS